MISFVVAMSKNYVIGKNNKLPWHLPEDLKFFKRITTGKTIVMGRKTYESIGNALPNRTNVILTRQAGFTAPGCRILHSVAEVLELSIGQDLYVIGGAEIFQLMFPWCNRLYITWIDQVVDGDTYFPQHDHSKWKWTKGRIGRYDAKNPYLYYFLVFDR
jgi:dihydrofolate reductase